MSIEKLCNYFEDIGLVNFTSINIFLGIYSQLSKPDKAIISNCHIRAKSALFNYIKHISSSKALLLDYCNQVIDKYSAWTMLKQYLFLSKLLIVVKYKINHQSLVALYKIKHHNQRRDVKEIKIKEEEKIRNSLNKKTNDLKMNNRKDKLAHLNYISSKNLNHCSLSHNNNNNQSRNKKLNNNNNYIGTSHLNSLLFNQTYSIKTNDNNNNNCNWNNHNKSFSNLKTKAKVNSSNKTLNINTRKNLSDINQTEESLKEKERCLTTQQTTSVDRFHSSQERHIIDHKKKILNIKLNEMKLMDSIYTFKPTLSHHNFRYRNRTFDSSSSDIPRYIKLNNDAMIHKSKLTQLRLKYHKEEMQQKTHKSHKAFHIKTNTINSLPNESYYDKLYQDAYDYQKRKKENQRRYYADISFKPTNINTNIPIKSTFNERTRKSIERKYQIRHRNENKKESKDKDKEERFSKAKIKEKNERVIDRLYNRHFQTESNSHTMIKHLTKSKDVNNLLVDNRKTIKENMHKTKVKAQINVINILNEIKKEHVINYKTQSNNSSKNIINSSIETYTMPNVIETTELDAIKAEKSSLSLPEVLTPEPISYSSQTMQNLLIQKNK